MSWRRPTFPEPCGSSIIGAGGLNGRVRDGNGCFPTAQTTKTLYPIKYKRYCTRENRIAGHQAWSPKGLMAEIRAAIFRWEN